MSVAFFLDILQCIRNRCVPIIRAYLQLHICFLPHGTNWCAGASSDGLLFTHVSLKPSSNRFIDLFTFVSPSTIV